jgi:hypothetical protein
MGYLCRERNIRSDTLDAFVFDQVREALLRPEILLAGESVVTGRAPAPDDELLGAQLARLERRRPPKPSAGAWSTSTKPG